MAENQEKELFNTLGTLVTGVRAIQIDVKDLKSDVQVLKSDVQVVKSDIVEIKETLKEHSGMLRRLDAKTDSIAETVLSNDKRLTAVEKEVSNLRGGIH